MINIKETSILDVFLIEQIRQYDSRGFFARTFCAHELAKFGINYSIDQVSTSFNASEGTLRGMHYQAEPHSEKKIVRCTRGAIYDVVLDLRVASPTYLKWITFELTAENGLSVMLPAGCAHGFQTLRMNSEVLYTNSGKYVAEASKTVRWDDPTFKIIWPYCHQRVMSEKDRIQPDFIG